MSERTLEGIGAKRVMVDGSHNDSDFLMMLAHNVVKLAHDPMVILAIGSFCIFAAVLLIGERSRGRR